MGARHEVLTALCRRRERWLFLADRRELSKDDSGAGDAVPFNALRAFSPAFHAIQVAVLRHLSHVSSQSPILVGHRSRTRRLFAEQYLYSRTKRKNERVGWHGVRGNGSGEERCCASEEKRGRNRRASRGLEPRGSDSFCIRERVNSCIIPPEMPRWNTGAV